MADDLLAFILARDLYVAPVALVGAGMGAAIALRMAALHPQLVGGLAMAAFDPAQALDAWWPAQAACLEGGLPLTLSAQLVISWALGGEGALRGSAW